MIRTLLALTLAASIAAAAPAQSFPDDPLDARLVVSDIALFWEVMDRATDDNRAELLQRDYIEAGSPGVRAFTPNRIVSGEALAAMIAERPDAYSPEARARMLRLLDLDTQIRAPLLALENLYPPAVFPDVYFVVGRLNSGGTASGAGLMIGAEMYAGSDEKMRELPWIVAHEWAHFNQLPNLDGTLLSAVLREGSADFLGELASGGHINAAAHAFGNANEAALWERFAISMRLPFQEGNAEGWMYGGAPLEGGPNDLGYYMGYQISKAYYDRADNKRRAIYDILNIRDSEAFLEASGYADRFGGVPPRADAPAAPTIESIIPANGAADVDPATTELVVVFSEPMQDAYSMVLVESREKFPPVSAVRWNADRTALTATITLEPGREYAFGLNAPGFMSFRSERGAAQRPVEVRFRTRDR
ncbi:MAG: Ig-like domain-containing protein [Phycisphaerales bacterium]